MLSDNGPALFVRNKYAGALTAKFTPANAEENAAIATGHKSVDPLMKATFVNDCAVDVIENAVTYERSPAPDDCTVKIVDVPNALVLAVVRMLSMTGRTITPLEPEEGATEDCIASATIQGFEAAAWTTVEFPPMIQGEVPWITVELP